MIKLLHIGLMVLLLLVVGCNRKAVPSTTTIVKDSIHVEYVYRDVPVEVPGETVTNTIVIDCDSLTNKPKAVPRTKAKSGRAIVEVSLDNQGNLTATGGCDSLTKIVQVMDKEIFRLKHEKKETVTVVTEFKTRGIDKFCRMYTGITLALIVGYTILKFKPI